MIKDVTVNKEQQLYVIRCGKGYTCLGFNVAFDKATAIAKELNALESQPDPENIGTLDGYKDYNRALEAAFNHAERTKQRLECELTPQLMGLERKRVEVIDCYGEKRRFIVGKSTGFIPCHLEIKTKRSLGGGAVTGSPFKSVKVIG